MRSDDDQFHVVILDGFFEVRKNIALFYASGGWNASKIGE